MNFNDYLRRRCATEDQNCLVARPEDPAIEEAWSALLGPPREKRVAIKGPHTGFCAWPECRQEYMQIFTHTREVHGGIKYPGAFIVSQIIIILDYADGLFQCRRCIETNTPCNKQSEDDQCAKCVAEGIRCETAQHFIDTGPNTNASEEEEDRIVCPRPGCTKTYTTLSGLVRHGKTKHRLTRAQILRSLDKANAPVLKKEEET